MNGSDRGITSGPLFEPLERRLLLSAGVVPQVYSPPEAVASVEVAECEDEVPTYLYPPLYEGYGIDPRLIELRNEIEAQKAIDPDYDASELPTRFPYVRYVTPDGEINVRIVLDAANSRVIGLLTAAGCRGDGYGWGLGHFPSAIAWVSYLSLDAAAAIPDVQTVRLRQFLVPRDGTPQALAPKEGGVVDPFLRDIRRRIEFRKALDPNFDPSEMLTGILNIAADGRIKVRVSVEALNEEVLGMLEAAGLQVESTSRYRPFIHGWVLCGSLDTLAAVPGVRGWLSVIEDGVEHTYIGNGDTWNGGRVQTPPDEQIKVVVRLTPEALDQGVLGPLEAVGLRIDYVRPYYPRVIGWVSYLSLDAVADVPGVSDVHARYICPAVTASAPAFVTSPPQADEAQPDAPQADALASPPAAAAPSQAVAAPSPAMRQNLPPAAPQAAAALPPPGAGLAWPILQPLAARGHAPAKLARTTITAERPAAKAAIDEALLDLLALPL